MGKLIITEEERLEILSKYGLILEQSALQFRGSSFFGNGLWKNLTDDAITKITAKFNELESILTENPNSVIEVQIWSSESKVPNSDLEVRPPKKLPDGELAKRRAETLKKYLEDKFKSFVDSGILKIYPEFKNPIIQIGKQEYDPTKGDKPNDKKYEGDRWVAAEFKVFPSRKCLASLVIEVSYKKEKSDEPRYKCRGNHRCNDAVFDILINDIPIGKANLNNEDTGGDKTSGKIGISSQLIDRILQNNSDEIELAIKCASSNCHSSTPEVLVYNTLTKLLLFDGCAAPIAGRGDSTKKVILVMNPCGRILQKGRLEDIMSDSDVPSDNTKVRPVKWPGTTGTPENFADKRPELLQKQNDGTFKVLKDFGLPSKPEGKSLMFKKNEIIKFTQ